MTLEKIEQIENYVLGTMSSKQKLAFENELKENKELFLLCKDYKELISLMQYKNNRDKLISQLQQLRASKNNTFSIKNFLSRQESNVLYFAYKHKTLLSVAAMLVLLVVSVVYLLSILFTHTSELTELKRNLSSSINKLEHKIDATVNYTNGKTGTVGTGFLIDNDGYLITNSHIVSNDNNLFIENQNGDAFQSEVIYADANMDIAILKVKDSNFKFKTSVPYHFSESKIDLGETLFTLGYPKDEIVYSEGYLSSENGFNSDSTSMQVNISLNPGNSGGPIFDANGNIVGIVKNKQKEVDGVSFAIKSKYIVTAIKKLKTEDTSGNFNNLNIKVMKFTSNKNKINQIKQFKPFIFIVKSFS